MLMSGWGTFPAGRGHTGLTASAGVAEGLAVGDVLGHFSCGVRQYLSPELRLGFGYRGITLGLGATQRF
jgi:hypothetical protein